MHSVASNLSFSLRFKTDTPRIKFLSWTLTKCTYYSVAKCRIIKWEILMFFLVNFYMCWFFSFAETRKWLSWESHSSWFLSAPMLDFVRFLHRFLPIRIFFSHRKQAVGIIRISPGLDSLFIHASFFVFYKQFFYT